MTCVTCASSRRQRTFASSGSFQSTGNKRRTVPADAFTSRGSPSVSVESAPPTATMQGMPNSRATTAAWHSDPPSSVITAAAIVYSGTHETVDCRHTRTSPSRIFEKSPSSAMSRAGPRATPGEAVTPLRTSVPSCVTAYSKSTRSSATPGVIVGGAAGGDPTVLGGFARRQVASSRRRRATR